jgi:hypothetical protein
MSRTAAVPPAAPTWHNNTLGGRWTHPTEGAIDEENGNFTCTACDGEFGDLRAAQKAAAKARESREGRDAEAREAYIDRVMERSQAATIARLEAELADAKNAT